MNYLLDASTLVPLLTDYGEKIFNITDKTLLYTLDLTFYEVGNSLWKMATLLHIVSLDDAIEIIEVLKDLTRKGYIKTIHFNELNPTKIIKLATNEKITFYDSAYIIASQKYNTILVTEDKELIEKAKKHINVITYTQFKKQLTK